MTVLQAPIVDARRIVDECLAAGVPVTLGRDDHCTKGCSPKLLVLARPDDAPRFQALMQARFRDMVLGEGTYTPPRAAEITDDAMPCPACGAMIENAMPQCPDCGLVC